MKLAKGYNRVVLLVGRLAIKFPNPGTQRQFIRGMACNQKEYELYQESNNDPRLMRIYTLGFLGLWLVCKRYEVLDRELTIEERDSFPITELDEVPGNFGIENGKLVVIDYGYACGWYVSKDGNEIM